RKQASLEDILWSIHEIMVKKIISLLNMSNHPINNALVIGGLVKNDILMQILKDKLPQIKLVTIPESHLFEAYGTALLTKDHPIHKTPHISLNPMFQRLPGLNDFTSEVTIIPSSQLSTTNLKGPFILGIDCGSTTTKAVLFNINDSKIVASHYTRTSGDPITATKECIQAIIDTVGNHDLHLVATTGSAREIVGAFTGTSAVYNEISAHTAGATFFDPDVDTIFEIGGQDSKYVFIQNAVPIDYAMNAACSAGTGSFLEESAHGDLGLSVFDIETIALSSLSPVQFKSECAAFINSDIRSALQEGYSKEDIVAGLVYSIVDNYLTKVKGKRRVGKKIFFQGGVAKNKAVACAFAQITGNHIIVPPYPELMGAYGVALMANERYVSGILEPRPTSLQKLVASSITVLKSFTCQGCENYCEIERYEVGERRFPFGGKCSKYENRWKNIQESYEVDDFVDKRNKLIFEELEPKSSTVKSHSQNNLPKFTIGIPRALTAHFLFPLYYSFFNELGMNVIVSDIHPDGEFKTKAPFCFPIQIAHGAVLDLIEQNESLDYIFLPQIQRMPFKESKFNSYLCPITQGSPYVIQKVFEKYSFLTPVLNFLEGYKNCNALVTMAVSRLDQTYRIARKAYRRAVQIQLNAELSLQKIGKEALSKALSRNSPSVIIVGRSYNAYPKETSHSIGRKLASKGILAIPHDCLGVQKSNQTIWYFSNLILDAVKLSKKHKNLFILFISNFGCNIDAFTQEYLQAEIQNKPYLILEIDAHTAEAGTQTRLEAFIEIVENYRRMQQTSQSSSFQACKIVQQGKKYLILTSSGEYIEPTNPRVKFYFPTFSKYHNEAISLGLKWLGFHAPKPSEPNHEYLNLGLQNTSGKACLPLAMCIGHLLTVYREREKGEIIGFFGVSCGDPCVVTAYKDVVQNFIEENQLDDVFTYV
ncbi:MAG: acyl-CoA dehydratase activase, partial [Candidatus Hodarchaeota archaeon]